MFRGVSMVVFLEGELLVDLLSGFCGIVVFRCTSVDYD